MRAGFFDRPARKPPGRAAASTEAPAAPVPAHASLDELVKRGWRFGHACVNDDLAEGATNVLLLLHGRGDAPETFARLASSLNLPRTACVALAGTRALPFDLPGREWFPREDLITAEPIDWRLDAQRRRADAVVDAARRVADLVDALAPRFPSERVHVFGFADGGWSRSRWRRRSATAIEPRRRRRPCATRLPERLAAIAAVGSEPAAGFARRRGVTSSFPVTIVVGEGDRPPRRRPRRRWATTPTFASSPRAGGASSPREETRCPRGRRARRWRTGENAVDAAPRARGDFGEGVREVPGGGRGRASRERG